MPSRQTQSDKLSRLEPLSQCLLLQAQDRNNDGRELADPSASAEAFCGFCLRASLKFRQVITDLRLCDQCDTRKFCSFFHRPLEPLDHFFA